MNVPVRKRDSSLIGGVSPSPDQAPYRFLPPNFATVREFTARSFRHSGKNGSRLNVNCSVIFLRAYLINRNAILNGEGEGNGVVSELEANLLTETDEFLVIKVDQVRGIHWSINR